jgi:hypothetical protein
MPGEATIGIVTAKAVELAAVRIVLDAARDRRAPGDPNYYCVGSIPAQTSTRHIRSWFRS